MRREKSCGAVIYKKDNGKYKFLVEEMIQGHFAFPKGHVENLESEHETARREIKEETNLDVKFYHNFRYHTSYSPAKNVIKDVIYFLAEDLSSSPLNKQETEIKNLLWLTYDEALEKITFDNDKEILRSANQVLENI